VAQLLLVGEAPVANTIYRFDIFSCYAGKHDSASLA
jgi:hypothetical protein